MKKIWKTWKPRKKESRGNQELYFINTPTPRKMKNKVLAYVPTEAAPSTAPHRTAQPPRTPTYSIS